MNANRKLASIAVLVSVGRHSVSGVPRYSRNDAAALEIGRALAAPTVIANAPAPINAAQSSANAPD
ncbi:hypothetical protein LV178_19770, partial [Burkholderia mallei]|nr:hypothetical protein [Burkholderia mallei]